MIAAYMRLSMADENTDIHEESNSIIGQRNIIRNYILTHEDLKKEPVEEFVDDGFTGTNTNRPAFQEMIWGVKNGRIRTIIVKDFSRFARDYIEAGDYLERIFPFLGVRFIAVHDGYDSLYHSASGNAQLELAVKNIVNASYSKDISAKVRATKELHMQNCLYLGGYRPYGFAADPEDCHKLVVDPVAGEYVRFIFKLAADGKKSSEIAAVLNREGIPTPAQYRIIEHRVARTQKSWNLRSAGWTTQMVTRIISNEKYKGTYVARRVVQAAPCSKKILTNDPENIFRKDDAHIALIPEEQFELAQHAVRTARRRRETQTHSYLFKGKVCCGYCGRILRHFDSIRSGSYFVCKYSKTREDSPCRSEKIPESYLSELVSAASEREFLLIIKAYEKLNQASHSVEMKKQQLEEEAAAVRSELETLEGKKLRLYEQYVDDQFTREVFSEKRDRLIARITAKKERLSSCLELLQSLEEYGDREMGGFKAFAEAAMQQPEAYEELVKQIVVYNTERVEIRWKYENVIEDVLKKGRGM